LVYNSRSSPGNLNDAYIESGSAWWKSSTGSGTAWSCNTCGENKTESSRGTACKSKGESWGRAKTEVFFHAICSHARSREKGRKASLPRNRKSEMGLRRRKKEKNWGLHRVIAKKNPALVKIRRKGWRENGRKRQTDARGVAGGGLCGGSRRTPGVC